MKHGLDTHLRAGLRSLAAALLLSGACISVQALEPTSTSPDDTDSQERIRLFLEHPVVHDRIEATGMDAAELSRDLRNLSVSERNTLADLLERGWPGLAISRQVTLTADYLMLVALMRESRLFASVVTPLAAAAR